MMNSPHNAAGIPAPFDTLEPLRHYITLLEQVVADPSPTNLQAYVAYDRDVFSPAVVLYSQYGHSNRGSYGIAGFRSCILYDTVSYVIESDNPTNARLRNAARVVLHGVAQHITLSSVFPYGDSRSAFQMIDDVFVRLIGDDPKHLAFARKLTSLDLLNAWSQAKYWPVTVASRPDYVIGMAEIGWEVFGAPYGSARLAKFLARMSPRTNR